MFDRPKVSLIAVLALSLPLLAAEGPVVDTMDDLSTFTAPKEKGKIEAVDGKVGKAIKFSFDNDCKGVFAMGKVRATPEWDKAAGLSFWVKGDGSDHFGGIQFIYNEDYGVRYTACFPIDNTDWKKVVIPWSDFVAVLSNTSKRLDPKDGNLPSKLSGMWIGKWWFWKDYAAHSFSMDDVHLEPAIETDKEEYKPSGDPLARVQAKLKAGKPVTVVTMGDSLTDYGHWANKETNWPTLLKQKLKEKFKSDATIVNPAIGGTELRQNMMLIPRWAKGTPEPDLVTVEFAYNDYGSMVSANLDAAARGELFYESMKEAIDRVRRATKGKADVLLFTAVPAVDKWTEFAEFVAAVKKVAKEKNVGVADMDAVFHEAGKDNKEHLYCSDKTHMGAPGHELIATTVITAIEKAGK